MELFKKTLHIIITRNNYPGAAKSGYKVIYAYQLLVVLLPTAQ